MLLVLGRNDPPQLLGDASVALVIATPSLGSGAGTRPDAGRGSLRRPLEPMDQALAGITAIALLGPEALCLDNQHTIGADPAAG